MNANGETTVIRRSRVTHPELWLMTALLILANLPLLSGRPSATLIFLPERVAAGEWWRILTYPLAHVGWYHLLLDGTAFLQLINSLGGLDPGRRLFIVLGGGAGSLLLPLALPSPIREVGICGLSGIDHGLMAVAGIMMLREKDQTARRQGGCLLAVVVLKSLIEASTGRILLESLHRGFLGVPVASSHLGGILGALSMLGALHLLRGRTAESHALAESTTWRRWHWRAWRSVPGLSREGVPLSGSLMRGYQGARWGYDKIQNIDFRDWLGLRSKSMERFQKDIDPG